MTVESAVRAGCSTISIAMASLRNVVRRRPPALVYGVDLMRGIARVDAGTGGGSPRSPTTRRSSIRTRRPPRTCNRNGSARNGESDLCGPARRARRRPRRRVLALARRHRATWRRRCSCRLNAATAFRAPTAEELYYPGFSNPNLVARANARRRRDDRRARRSRAASASAGSRRAARTSSSRRRRTYIPENVGHASIAGLTFTA